LAASERAADLTKQLLAYAGKGRFMVEPVSLSAMIREISELVQSSIPRSVQLRLDLQKDLPLIEADTSQLQQLIMNLVINGAEAIGDQQSGTVSVTTGVQEVDDVYIRSTLGHDITPGTYIFLEVHDTGCGMDEPTIARIFDPFFTTKFTGRGLGLSAALGIVRGHKGALKVYSTPGRGSTFKLLFPVAAGGITQPAGAVAGTGLAGSGMILIVDDEATVRTTAKLALERHGYTVLLATNGQDAIEIFNRHRGEIRLVIMDLTMPVMGGEEAIRKLRAADPGVLVILSSGFNEVEAIQRFTGKGLTGFLQKPYTAAALAEKVKGALHAGAQMFSAGAEQVSE
jgi:CheY-like chemotaxis protein